jgi:hypothetical protein
MSAIRSIPPVSLLGKAEFQTLICSHRTLQIKFRIMTFTAINN